MKIKQINKKINVSITVFIFFVFMILFFNNIALISVLGETETKLETDLTTRNLGEIIRQADKTPEQQILDTLKAKNSNVKIDQLDVVFQNNTKANIQVGTNNNNYKKTEGNKVEVTFTLKTRPLSEIFSNRELGAIKLSQKDKKTFEFDDLLTKILEKNIKAPKKEYLQQILSLVTGADLKTNKVKIKDKQNDWKKVYEGEVEFSYTYFFDLSNFIDVSKKLDISIPQEKTLKKDLFEKFIRQYIKEEISKSFKDNQLQEDKIIISDVNPEITEGSAHDKGKFNLQVDDSLIKGKVNDLTWKKQVQTSSTTEKKESITDQKDLKKENSKDKESTTEDVKTEDKDKSSNVKWWISLGIAIVIATLAFVGYYFYNMNKKKLE
ncbi:hypothetical protein [Candidatus Phytoplasma fraxini]|uniref:Uncharacterized protein n=1 Tax=Ash yellows phytoplasma TaxID=35780 RepID=A0ABZ2UA26_ASHYP